MIKPEFEEVPLGTFQPLSFYITTVAVAMVHVEVGSDDPKVKVLSVADILARTIKNVFEDESVSEIFAGENQLF